VVRRIPSEELKLVQGGLIPYGTREFEEQGEIVTLIDLETLLSDLDRAAGASGDAG